MTCSTGRDSANVVNPRRSMNITVAHRRTAPIDGRPPVAVRSSAAIGSGRKRVKTSFTRCCSRSWRRRRLSPDPIRARRIAGSNGLGRKSSAPASMHRTMAAVSSTPEIMITGTWRSPSWSLRRSSTSMPSRPGISTSRSTRSGGSVSSAASASKPFSNWTVPCPSFSRCLASNRRFNGSSSTIAIVAGGVSQTGQATPRSVGPAGRRHVFEREDSLTPRRGRTTEIPRTYAAGTFLLGSMNGSVAVEPTRVPSSVSTSRRVPGSASSIGTQT